MSKNVFEISDLGGRLICPTHHTLLHILKVHTDAEGEITHWDVKCPESKKEGVVFND